MDTPICDFVKQYQEKNPVRLHMPGHKGRGFSGAEKWDITEIPGADELFHPQGIILKSEENAASLFGAGKTLYSTEGSSLCIRAMVFLALLFGRERGREPVILAGRNAHKTFLSAAALLDVQVEWLFPETESGLMACPLTAAGLERALQSLPHPPCAVYVTSPDYLGNLTDIAALSRVCRKRDILLLVDNAHGAYLRFLPQDQHPLSQGADLCCDSAHKTLPALTGAAYLHLGKNAPACCFQNARRAMALFASTSPSYLILQSLDQCNAYLSGSFPQRLSTLSARLEEMKDRLREKGFSLAGGEKTKITLVPKAFGYTGNELHQRIRNQGVEGEFSDPDYLTLMFSPSLDEKELERTEKALLSIPRKAPILKTPPPLPRPRQALSIRRAMLSLSRETPVQDATGSILSDALVSCPPCVPIVCCGEIIDDAAISCFLYYGLPSCRVVEEAGLG